MHTISLLEKQIEFIQHKPIPAPIFRKLLQDIIARKAESGKAIAHPKTKQPLSVVEIIGYSLQNNHLKYNAGDNTYQRITCNTSEPALL